MNRNILLVCIVSFFFLACGFSGLLYGISTLPSVYDRYEMASSDISNDPIILNVSNICSSSNDKVFCVYQNVPITWDFIREDASLSPNVFSRPIFLSPEEYFGKGGVCRDITVIRHSVLANIGIECIFNFDTPNHVYLNCFDNGTMYELNNGRFFKYE